MRKIIFYIIVLVYSNSIILGKGSYDIGSFTCSILERANDEQNHQQEPDSTAIQILNDLKNNKNSINIYTSFHSAKQTSNLFLKQMKLDEGIQFLSAYLEQLESYGAHDTLKAEIILNRAKLHHWKGAYDIAMLDYKLALDFFEDNKVENTKIASTLKNLGQMYTIKGDFESALIQLYKAKDILYGKNDLSLAMVFLEIGIVHNIQGDHLKAYNCFKNGIPLVGSDSEHRAYLLVNLGQSLLTLDKKDSASICLNQALEICERAQDLWAISAICLNLGQISFDQEDYKKAREYYQRSLVSAKEVYGPNHRELAKIYYHSGKLDQACKDYDNALASFQKGLKVLIVDFEPQNIFQNPVQAILHPEPWIMILLGAKGECLNERYKVSSDMNDLIASMDCYKVASDQIILLRNYYWSDGAKQYLGTYAHSILEQGIISCLDLYAITKEQDIIYDAFLFSESGKAMILLEDIHESNIQQLLEIPDSLKTKQLEFEKSIVYHNMVLHEEENKATTQDSLLKPIRDTLFKLNRNYAILIEEIVQEYPQYIQARKVTNPIEKQQIEAFLNANKETGIVEFFSTDSAIYIFFLTADSSYMAFIDDIETFNKLVYNLLESIKDPKLQYINPNEAFKNFTNSSHKIYSLLFADFLKSLKNDSIENLIIIPDGLLSYLPFEVLLREVAKTDIPDFSSDNLNYLIIDYSIKYSNSLALHLAKNTTSYKQKDKQLACFVPDFSQTSSTTKQFCNEKELNKLKHAYTEATIINELIDGDIFSGNNATKEDFLLNGPEYSYVHIATHACENNDNPMRSKIFFTNGYLSAYELYGLELNNDLIVLSACNTGMGEYIVGEGVMSLARGFSFAGCKCSVISLWAVDDLSTSKIMSGFYSNLAEGLRADYALQKAKKDFFSSMGKQYHHPHFWAAFILSGNPVEIIAEGHINYSLVMLLILAIIIGTIIIYMIYRRRSGNRSLKAGKNSN